MADSDDTDIQYLGLLVPALTAFIPGLMIHSFIIGVNATDWWKGRSVTAVDHIVTSLGISRMCAQSTKTIQLVVIRLFLSRYNVYEQNMFNFGLGIVYIFIGYVNFWLTSLLSIVLCLKISNFHSRLFLYLRGVIAHRTVYFIVAGVILSAFNVVIPLLVALSDMHRDGIYNAIMPNLSMHCVSSYYIYTYTVGASIPLLFCCISSVVLFTSLYHHTTKMKMSRNLSINLEAYYSLMRFIFLTFMYKTIYFIGHFLCICYYYFSCVYLEWLRIVMEFLPVLHSSYLIYRTAKLRSQMSKVLQYLSDFVFQRKDTETRETIEVVTL
ncbi:hypothetical protein GDO78_020890 [Eleutherodactylus coqui]|uniref:Taste receptor type 2 n=1 Tax=Eleutherodactylus coqui TaxID=57060 RepID=A0A8J6JT35_ELECQ|nr:hypothetical protein GDO78_020890 [Eleutherodactylus coqui]